MKIELGNLERKIYAYFPFVPTLHEERRRAKDAWGQAEDLGWRFDRAAFSGWSGLGR